MTARRKARRAVSDGRGSGWDRDPSGRPSELPVSFDSPHRDERQRITHCGRFDGGGVDLSTCVEREVRLDHQAVGSDEFFLVVEGSRAVLIRVPMIGAVTYMNVVEMSSIRRAVMIGGFMQMRTAGHEDQRQVRHTTSCRNKATHPTECTRKAGIDYLSSPAIEPSRPCPAAGDARVHFKRLELRMNCRRLPWPASLVLTTVSKLNPKSTPVTPPPPTATVTID